MSFGDFVKKASDFEIMLAMIARQELKNQFEVVEHIKSKGWDVNETRAAIAEACAASGVCYQLYGVIDAVVNQDGRRKFRAFQLEAMQKYGIVPRSREHFVFLVGVESKAEAHIHGENRYDHILHCHFDDRLDHFFHLGYNTL